MGSGRSSQSSEPGYLSRDFFARPALEVAPELLGCVFAHESEYGTVAVRLTEVEAYAGVAEDAASHAFRGRTKRNEVLFGDPGVLYVYFTYGMHWCANVVCQPLGDASAVLLRAGEIVEGIELARSRRSTSRRDTDLASGPARLTRALGIDGNHNGIDVLDPRAPIRLIDRDLVVAVTSGPRVGITGASVDWPWRFWVAGDATVSRWRPGKQRASR